MITEESLRRDVLQYLRTNYSIKLDLPILKRHYSETISLRLFRSPLGQSHENRYAILIKQAQNLLRKNIINTDKIKDFGQNFFETISQDITVLQGNEQIRKSFTKIREQIFHRIEDLTSGQKDIEEECKAINDKEQILTFLDAHFRGYLNQVKQVSQQYEAVNNIQILTSINIDSLYSEKLGNQEDYFQHYQPLLEVMQRLKSNMVKLYQELNRCEYFQLPLKSVNFLANCKNLLQELEPFLINPDCVFNRLIFYVVKGQKQNNRLIGRIFHANTAFSNDVVSDIFKAFFLSHIFKDHYRSLNAKISQERENLIKYFEISSVNSDNFYGQVLKTEKNLNVVKSEIEQIRRVIGMGKDKIMRSYLGRKECKKLNLLNELEHNSNQNIKFAKSMLRVLKFKTRLQMMRERVEEAERHSKNTENAIKEQEEVSLKPTQGNIKELNDKIQARFQQSYILIQEGILQLSQTRQYMLESTSETQQSYFNQEFFPNIEKGLTEIEERYISIETNLLNSYQGLRKERMIKTGQAKEQSKIVLEELADYFQTKVLAELGHEIRNEDEQCQEVKDNIIKVEKVEFFLNNYLNSSNTKTEQAQLSKYKVNLECLLQVFQGSMDQKIFQSFMEKLNFQASDWQVRTKKVKQLVRELKRYVTTLKKGLSENGSKYLPRVSKLVKNRVQLYQVIQDMYEQFLLIYETCKSNSQLNPPDHGIKLFDQSSYKYVLMLYQYLNRTRAETQELKDLLLPKRTLNYLLDDIYEPFLQIFSHFASYNQQQLLNFTLRLEHALNLKVSQHKISQLYQQTLSKPYSSDYFNDIETLSLQMVQLKEQNKKVLDLEKEEVVVYNLKEFKDRAAAIEEHELLAQAILKGLKENQMELDIQLQNPTLSRLKDKIIRDWRQHKQLSEKSGKSPSINDFSP